jgi:magnesium-transporting ATPase (P-type)
MVLEQERKIEEVEGEGEVRGECEWVITLLTNIFLQYQKREREDEMRRTETEIKRFSTGIVLVYLFISIEQMCGFNSVWEFVDRYLFISNFSLLICYVFFLGLAPSIDEWRPIEA